MDTEIIDNEAESEFALRVPAAVAACGGRILVRTSSIEAVQSDWTPRRLVILEFDNLKATKGPICYAEYACLNDVRQPVTKANLVVTERADSQI